VYPEVTALPIAKMLSGSKSANINQHCEKRPPELLFLTVVGDHVDA
jgi:hypothetical protein